MYKTKVNAAYSFTLSKDEIDALDAVETSAKNYHILKNNNSIKASITASNFDKKNYTITVNNNSYEVLISDQLDQQIEALGFEIGATKQINAIKAPMPGLILEIAVKKGQTVNEGEPLVILEAMKMENVLTSPREGTIKSIAVNQGETVDKNALLVEFE